MEKKILFLVFCPQGFGQLAGLDLDRKLKSGWGLGGMTLFNFLAI